MKCKCNRLPSPFHWAEQSKGSEIFGTREFKMAETARQNMKGKGNDPKRQFTIYSKARASK